jgi:medium-chain acyl-[acyl-carrier-protein] hydrolase
MRLICFPHAGAGPSQFRSWRAAGPASLSVTALALPARESRYKDAMPHSLEALVDDLLPRVEALLDQPFALLGHSMGALLAFELTRTLRRLGKPLPQRLFVSAFRAPQLADPRAPLHTLSAPQLKAELLHLAGTPADVLDEPELMEMLLPVLRADLAIVERYRHRREAPLPCPLTCLGGVTDERVSRAELCAWQQQTARDFRLHLFPGAHFYLYKTPALVQRAMCADLGLPLDCPAGLSC